MKLLIMGAPGAGKGSASEVLVKKTGIIHLSMGDLLRYDKDVQKEFGTQINPLLKEGKFVSDDLAITIIKHKLHSLGEKASFLLDGFPRTVYQTKKLLGFTTLTGCIQIVLDDKKIIDRLSNRWVCKCGATYNLETKPPKKAGVCDFDGKPLFQRDDDKPEVVRKRLEIYHKKTEPVLAFLKEKNIPFLQIKGDWDVKMESDMLVEKIIAWQKAL